MNQDNSTSLNNQSSLYSKLFKIQKEVGMLVRNEENKFQKFKYFNEKQCLELLKPLLEKHKVAIFFSDVVKKEQEVNELDNFFYLEKKDSGWVVKYLKKAIIVNIQDEISARDIVNQQVSQGVVDYIVKEESIIEYFYCVGLSTDPSKAKGAAETYGIKYFLSKYFLIPVRDENEPDSFGEISTK